MNLPFTLPSPAGGPPAEWTSEGFRIGSAVLPVLEFSDNFAGWSEDLTTLHEETAGASHPIDIASRNDALAQLRAKLAGNNCPVILEIGCSTGFMLKAMIEAFPDATIVGADVVREPLLRLARELPSVPLLRFDLLRCPLPSASFDAVVMLNVLEHIEDDVAALRQVHRILKAGGVAVIEVPAGPHLYDTYDQGLMHFRRYAMIRLSESLGAVGFEVVRRSHLGFLIYPGFAYVKRRNQRRQRRSPAVDATSVVAKQASNTSSSLLLRGALTIERLLGKLWSLPLGIRCVVVGRKTAH